MSEAFLASLSPEDAVRYKVFLSSSLSPELIEQMVGDLLPPPSILDASTRERILLALSTSAHAFAVDLVERASSLRREEAASGVEGGLGAGLWDASEAASAPLRSGHVAEAYRRLALEGRVLGVGSNVPRLADALRDAASAPARGEGPQARAAQPPPKTT